MNGARQSVLREGAGSAALLMYPETPADPAIAKPAAMGPPARFLGKRSTSRYRFVARATRRSSSVSGGGSDQFVSGSGRGCGCPDRRLLRRRAVWRRISPRLSVTSTKVFAGRAC